MDDRESLSPTERLTHEHRVILSVLAALRHACGRLRAGADLDPADLERAVAFLRGYADAWHHGREEDVLFPFMHRAGVPVQGGPIGVMQHEHELGRHLVRRMARALEQVGEPGWQAELAEAAETFIALLGEHIQKEDHCLFPMALNVLGAEEREALRAAFDAREAELGLAERDRLEALAEEIVDALGTTAAEA